MIQGMVDIKNYKIQNASNQEAFFYCTFSKNEKTISLPIMCST